MPLSCELGHLRLRCQIEFENRPKCPRQIGSFSSSCFLRFSWTGDHFLWRLFADKLSILPSLFPLCVKRSSFFLNSQYSNFCRICVLYKKLKVKNNINFNGGLISLVHAIGKILNVFCFQIYCSFLEFYIYVEKDYSVGVKSRRNNYLLSPTFFFS